MTEAPDHFIITDGKQGDLAPCHAVMSELGMPAAELRAAPRPLFAVMAPWGPADPRNLVAIKASIQASKARLPMIMATGRRAYPILRAVKRRFGSAVFTTCLRDPRVRADDIDAFWVPEHDKLRGSNVVATLTGPHRFQRAYLDTLRRDPPDFLQAPQSARVAVLVGGNGKHHDFNDVATGQFLERLTALAATPASLMITTSRRTPESLVGRLRSTFANQRENVLWTGEGNNPLDGYLALADAVVVTSDSINMIGEAVATGRPVMVFKVPGGHKKFDALLSKLERQGAVCEFDGSLKRFSYPPIDSTPTIADFIRQRYQARLDALSQAQTATTDP